MMALFANPLARESGASEGGGVSARKRGPRARGPVKPHTRARAPSGEKLEPRTRARAPSGEKLEPPTRARGPFRENSHENSHAPSDDPSHEISEEIVDEPW